MTADPLLPWPGMYSGLVGKGNSQYPHQKAKASHLLRDLLADGHPAPIQALPCPL